MAAPLLERIPGVNLRALMQQKLARITDLPITSSNEQQPATTNLHSAPQLPQEPTYSTAFDPAEISGYSEHSQPLVAQPYSRQRYTSTDKVGPARQSTRAKTAVETPHLAALRTLLHHPYLAHKVDSANKLAAEDDLYAQLLVSLLEALQKSPELSPLQLITRWHGTEQGHLLRALAEKEWLIDADNLEQQFIDTITRLAVRQRERHIEQLLNKARSDELTDEEKKHLRTLLAQHNSAPNTA